MRKKREFRAATCCRVLKSLVRRLLEEGAFSEENKPAEEDMICNLMDFSWT
jgi:NAD(P)H-nitrite reductase large subunit